MRTEQQNKNLSDWLNIHWPAVKPENVDDGLQVWTRESECGAVHCFGGHVALNPDAQAQGAFLDGGTPGIRTEDGFIHYGFSMGEMFFGVDGLFDARSKRGFDARHRDLTDHELVSARLKWALDNPEAEVLA